MQDEQDAFWNALETDSYNGFAGFQASKAGKCIYIGQPFLDAPVVKYGSFSSHEINESEFLEDLRSHLPPEVAKEDVWITDWLGHNFLTVKAKDYNCIPAIIEACLASGTYRFLTHNGTPWKVIYRPGEKFTRANYEHKLILHMRDSKAEMEKYHDSGTAISILFGHGIRTYTKHWNWATDEGRAFCSELRGWLRKRKPVSVMNDRFNWSAFREQMEKHGISYAGGWNQYVPTHLVAIESPTKKVAHDDAQQEDVCMICLDRKPSTLVLPCMHQVVCDVCSKQLDKTPDNKICVQCRCAIETVYYADGSMVEKNVIKTGE